jgi:hypothetical protein
MSTMRDDGVMVTMFCGPSSDNLQACFGMVALARAFTPSLVPAHLSCLGVCPFRPASYISCVVYAIPPSLPVASAFI